MKTSVRGERVALYAICVREEKILDEERSWILKLPSFGHFILDDPSFPPPFHPLEEVERRGEKRSRGRRENVLSPGREKSSPFV